MDVERGLLLSRTCSGGGSGGEQRPFIIETMHFYTLPKGRCQNSFL